MILSMTGFASKSLEISSPSGGLAHLSLILKSVNSRYFEATCKLPYSLQPLENDSITIFKEKLYRGKITFLVHCSDTTIFRGPVEPSLATITSYLAAAKRVQQECTIPGTLTISDLVLIPDLFTSQEHLADEQIQKQILQVAHELCDQLTESRRSEGAALARDIKERSTILHKSIETITSKAARNFELHRQKVLKQLEPLLDGKEADLIRHQLHMELSKADITEELVRFKSHLASLRQTLESTDIEKGRRIDFLLQELGREINTIAAKAADADIGALVITIKVELEKIREQAQNIV
jgi:uncharacterized protein (TIGR00255 family)